MNNLPDSKRSRRLIYVDASGIENNTIFKISLYDKDNNATFILQLDGVDNSSEAEEYAIFYAIFYIKKHNCFGCHILCDNQSAVNSKMVQFLAKEYSIGISWIPREANIIADKIAKLEPTLKETDWNILKFFVELVKAQCYNVQDIQHGQSKEISALKEQIEKQKTTIDVRNTKISNQAKQITALKVKKEKIK
ncbi:MAG: Unknown protein [uncultured Sulfurovum sp.]|uniref:RNase H type-1 domain-containing protein n=1 Tax=uncultured Sulfurovum sp. TaxID=269237 RepID=A0A6S6SUK8_9BACT|nr:MAG: Unknown protein [uncultured Sulfurovum sp.]